jgi:hypothetical protein
MEAERMLHPIINQIGVDTQNDGKRRKDYDMTTSLCQILPQVKKNIFKTIRTDGQLLDLWIILMQQEEFQAFNKKFYMPNNAVLVVAGDFKTEEAKQWIQKYFGNIKRTCYRKTNFVEEPITTTNKATLKILTFNR